MGHGIKGVLDEIEQHAAECAFVYGDNATVCNPGKLEGDALGGREGLPLLGPGLYYGPKVLRGGVELGHTCQ